VDGAPPARRVSEYRIRLAREADADAICRIYNQGIEDRVATLETELRTPDERRRWIAARGPRHPVIVAETGTQPATTSNSPPTDHAEHPAPPTTVAWGSLNPFNPRECYRYVADFSIYVERRYRGKGAGTVVLSRLIELAREHGYHKMVLSAFPTNSSGMALYERMGFRTVGIYKEQGRLDGRWVDTIIMEKLLSRAD
jgi:L-amino acid N-acyltransferase YncA